MPRFRCESEKCKIRNIGPDEGSQFQRSGMERIHRGEFLFAPTKLRHGFAEMRVHIGKDGLHFGMLRKDERVYDLVQMFRVEIVDGKRTGNRKI